MSTQDSNTHFSNYHRHHDEPEEPQRITKAQWSPVSGIYALSGEHPSPSASEIEINLAIDSSLGSDDSTISYASELPSDPLQSQFASLSLSSSAYAIPEVPSLDDPLPLIYSSIPLRVDKRGGRKHHDLPFPLERSPPLPRNTIVRSYAIVEPRPARHAKSALASRSPTRLGLARSKVKPYSRDDPMRLWKPHVRFKREIKNKQEAKARMQRVGAFAHFAPHHQSGGDDKGYSEELERMLKKIKIADEEHRASQTPLIIPPLGGFPYERSNAPSPSSLHGPPVQNFCISSSNSRDTEMGESSEDEKMLVERSPLRDLWIELFGDDDPRYN